MANRSNTQIPEEEWLKHKAVIRRLFTIDNKPVQGKDGIMEIMRIQHNFTASKSQYETRFKKWRFLRNATKEDWKAVDQILIARKASGKMSNVYVHEKLIEKEKLRKQRARNRDNEHDTSIAHLPSYIRISTPPPPVEFAEELQSTYEDVCSQTCSAAMPERRPPSQVPSPQQLPNDNFRFDYPLLDSEQHLDFRLDDDQPMSEMFVPTQAFPEDVENDYSSFYPLVLSPCCHINPLDLERSPKSSSGNLRRAAASSLSFTDALSWIGLDISFISLAQKLIDELEMPFPVLFRNELKVLMPPDTFGEICDQMPPVQLIIFLVTLLVNNTLPYHVLEDPKSSQDILICRALNHLHSLSGPALIRFLDSFPEFIQQAMKESLFRSAIEMGAHRTVEILMNLNVGLQEVIITIENIRWTSIGRASFRGHVEIVRFLLANRAERDTIPSPIDHLCRFDERGAISDRTIEILDVLLGATHNLHFSKLDRYANYQDHRVLETALRNLPMNKWNQILKYQKTVRNPLADDLYSRSLEILMPSTVEQLESIQAIPGSAVLIQDFLRIATITDNAQFLKTALATGTKPEEDVLVRAVQNRAVAFTSLLLDVTVDSRFGGDMQIPDSLDQNAYEIVELLIKRDSLIPIKAEDRLFEPLLTAAVCCGRSEVVSTLLARAGHIRHDGYVLNSVEYALETAIELQHYDIVDDILDTGLGLGRPLSRNTTPALEAALKSRRFIDIVIKRIDRFLDHEVGFVLQTLLERGELELFRKLTSFGYSIDTTASSQVNGRNEMPRHFSAMMLCTLSKAIYDGQRNLVQHLLDIDHSITETYLFRRDRNGYINGGPLFAALWKGNDDIFFELISRGANPCDQIAVWQASKRGNMQAVQVLVRRFCEVYPRLKRGFGNEALQEAIFQGNIEMVELLIAHADCNTLTSLRDKKEESNALAEAITSSSSNNMEILDIVLGNEGNCEAIVWIDGLRYPGLIPKKTALLLAIDTFDLRKVKAIVAAGANINRIGLSHTPLQYATYIGAADIVDYLLSQGADPNQAAVVNGCTALQHAAGKGFVGIAAKLIAAGANVNAPHSGFHGRTAFEAAAEQGRIEMLIFLAKNDVDLLANEGEQYRNAIKFVEKQKHHVAKMLIQELYNNAQADSMRRNFQYLEGNLTPNEDYS